MKPIYYIYHPSVASKQHVIHSQNNIATKNIIKLNSTAGQQSTKYENILVDYKTNLWSLPVH